MLTTEQRHLISVARRRKLGLRLSPGLRALVGEVFDSLTIEQMRRVDMSTTAGG